MITLDYVEQLKLLKELRQVGQLLWDNNAKKLAHPVLETAGMLFQQLIVDLNLEDIVDESLDNEVVEYDQLVAMIEKAVMQTKMELKDVASDSEED